MSPHLLFLSILKNYISILHIIILSFCIHRFSYILDLGQTELLVVKENHKRTPLKKLDFPDPFTPTTSYCKTITLTNCINSRLKHVGILGFVITTESLDNYLFNSHIKQILKRRWENWRDFYKTKKSGLFYDFIILHP